MTTRLAPPGTTTVSGDALLGISGNITVAGETLILTPLVRQRWRGAKHQRHQHLERPDHPYANRRVNVENQLGAHPQRSNQWRRRHQDRGPARIRGRRANTYSGITTVNEGTLELRKS